MKINVFDISKNKKGEIELPQQFEEEIRKDLIERAVLSIRSHKKQPYGAFSEAGKRSSAKLSKRRRQYRGMYGLGISRSPRKILSRRGMRMFWVGAFAPNTVGGRRAHPPKSEKVIDKKINKKERRKAIRSAISATVINELVRDRGHIVPEIYPFALDGKFEELVKTKEVMAALKNFGLENELDRVSKKYVRAGRGKLRGRKYKTKKGPLIIVSKENKVMNAARNIPGVDIISVKNINAELLAPGAVPGRLTLWTLPAIKELEKENLFLN